MIPFFEAGICMAWAERRSDGRSTHRGEPNPGSVILAFHMQAEGTEARRSPILFHRNIFRVSSHLL